MGGPRGFEPPTRCLKGSRATVAPRPHGVGLAPRPLLIASRPLRCAHSNPGNRTLALSFLVVAEGFEPTQPLRAMGLQPIMPPRLHRATVVLGVGFEPTQARASTARSTGLSYPSADVLSRPVSRILSRMTIYLCIQPRDSRAERPTLYLDSLRAEFSRFTPVLTGSSLFH